jgi:hypothetical protein
MLLRVAAGACLLATAAVGSFCDTDSAYTTVWVDDFNGPLDNSSWTVQVGAGRRFVQAAPC